MGTSYLKKSNYRLVLSTRVRIYLMAVYLAISIGAALQISGSNWDIIWHGVGNVETFFTPPHSVIYSGVVLVIGSVVVGIIHTTKILQQKNIRSKKNILG